MTATFFSKVIYLILLVLVKGAFFNKIGEGYYELQTATFCIPPPDNYSDEFPSCTFSTIESPNSFKTECLQPGVLRIQGEYSIIKLQCSASYAIDFFYEGIQPTEAINVTWTKRVEANSNGQNVSFDMEILIRSVKDLYTFYKNKNLERNVSMNELYDYTRTGKYIIRGIWNQSLERSYFLFLEEDSAKPSLLRNPSTTEIILDKNQLTLPCLGSHYDANITVVKLSPEDVFNFNYIYDPVIGLKIVPSTPTDQLNQSRLFKCILQYKNYTDELTIKYSTDKSSKFIPYGLEELGSVGVGDVEINYKSRIDNESIIHVMPWCRVQSLDKPNTMITAVPAHNFAYLRLIRQFVLPQYMNRSYTLRKGTEKEILPREIRITEKNSLNDRFGVTFCQSGDEHRLIEYGTSHSNGDVIKIAYGKDWTFLSRDEAPISIFYILKLANEAGSKVLYANTVLTFSCRVHEAVVVKPTIWYTRRTNGTIIEEFMDYNWINGISYFKKNVSSDIKEVICSGSFWYVKTWRNVSISLDLVDGKPPIIKTVTTNYVFRPNLQHQILNCEVGGDPPPQLSWQFNGLDISSNAVRTGTSILLDFPNIRKTHAGQYICIGENRFGRTEKIFQVRVEDEPSVNYGYVIGIPTCILLVIMIGISIYVRRWKKQQIGLTQGEIEEFINGQINDNNIRASILNQYAHDFAHLVPYDVGYEIAAAKFQIDESTVLGSGAYGTVFKGLVDGVPVAVKTVKRDAEKSYLKALLSELKIMIYLGSHPNVIQFIGSNTSKLSSGSVFIFVTYYRLGNLENYLKANRQNYSPSAKLLNNYTNSFGYEKLILWSKEIALGMQYLGSKKVIHGDLAARNVLLSDDLHAKITDFGLSRQLYDYANYVKKNQEPLPWRWLAIESLRDMTFSTQSDVWSFGVTVWEIFSLGEVPYPGFSWNMSFIEELEKGLRMRKPKYASDIFYEVILSECWHESPETRPTFQTICDRLDEYRKNAETKQLPYSPITNTY